MDEDKIRSIIENGTDSEQTADGLLKDCKHQISPCECEYRLMREAGEQALALLDKERERVKELEDRLSLLSRSGWTEEQINYATESIVEDEDERLLAEARQEELRIKDLEDRLAWLQANVSCPHNPDELDAPILCHFHPSDVCAVCKHLGRHLNNSSAK